MRLRALYVVFAGLVLAASASAQTSQLPLFPTQVANQASQQLSAVQATALAERQQLAALGVMDDWSCASVGDLTTRQGRLAYVWSVGYVAGRSNPGITGTAWRSSTASSQTQFQFDESMVDAVRGYCLLNPDAHLGEMQFTPRQEVAMGRLFKILSSYRWADIVELQRNREPGASVLTHRARSVMMDGFIAGQYTAPRTADQIIKQGSAPWMCDAYEAMAADPNLPLREAAIQFYLDQANVPYHQAACARANFALLQSAGQLNQGALLRARQAGQPISLPRAIDAGPEF